jgi:glycosyltransferase involved in cell wall biosynthesis
MEIILANVHFKIDAGGGAENYVYRVAKQLQSRGHTVSILTTKRYQGQKSLRPELTEVDGLPVWQFYPINISHRGDGTGDNHFTKAIWHSIDSIGPFSEQIIGDLLDREDPDVVHTNNVLGMSSTIGKTIQRRSIRHIHTLHDYSLICPKSNLLRDFTAPGDERTVCENPPTPCRLLAKQKRRGLGKPNIVTGPSQHVINVHKQHGFFDDVCCEVVQLGVESVIDQPPTVPDDPAFLYVGAQKESKGLDILFSVAEQLPDIMFHICGDGPYAEVTEQRATELDNVVYNGFVPEKKLAQLRQKVTAAVVPSIWMENSPLTIYESFAAGLPVIGSDIGGIPELVADGERGYTFEPKSTVGLIEAIERMLNHGHEMRQSVVEWARTRSIETHVDQLESLYQGDSLPVGE